jgi:2-polyprenyl-3-methyl-5-hydroxy-6-metoxy-1,4-benzoquinol methylase
MPTVSPETYAQWRSTKLGRITEKLELDLVLELAGPFEGKHVLDVGTGDGTYAIVAAERGARVVGLDLSPEMLGAARVRAEQVGVELDLREGTAEVLPFADGEFDLVLAVTVLCFVTNPRGASGRLVECVACGGTREPLMEAHRIACGVRARAYPDRARGIL